VLQVRDTLLPLEACYYATSMDDLPVKYADGLAVPAGGLEFVPSLVGAPLYVYILDGGPSNAEVTKSVDGAVAIWKKAGIILLPSIKSLGKQETVALLGKDERIGTYMTCEGRFNKQDLEARKRLSELKPNHRALAIFFYRNTEWTQSEPELLQSYIGNDPNPGMPGLTVAHEIGHLFFGAGHVGGEARKSCLDPTDQSNPKQPVVVTSRLMEYPQSSGDITHQDAILARKTLLSNPDARWW
jgi:hypothetical protein